MSKVVIERAMIEQVLEALEYNRLDVGKFNRINAACQALRAALAQQDEPVEEPVAWTGYDLEGMVEAFSRVIEAHHSSKHPFHNPIDMDAMMALRILRGFIPAMKAYATPPQRKPLTEEEIMGLCAAQWASHPVEVARVVEQAHGIKE
jgi:hypothetical protein